MSRWMIAAASTPRNGRTCQAGFQSRGPRSISDVWGAGWLCQRPAGLRTIAGRYGNPPRVSISDVLYSGCAIPDAVLQDNRLTENEEEAHSGSAGSGDLLHGGRGTVRSRGALAPERLPGRHRHLATRAPFVEPAHRADGGRTGQRTARGRWLLRLGQARAGSVLGVSRSVAFSVLQRVRHGHLPDSVRSLSRASVA